MEGRGPPPTSRRRGRPRSRGEQYSGRGRAFESTGIKGHDAGLATGPWDSVSGSHPRSERRAHRPVVRCQSPSALRIPPNRAAKRRCHAVTVLLEAHLEPRQRIPRVRGAIDGDPARERVTPTPSTAEVETSP